MDYSVQGWSTLGLDNLLTVLAPTKESKRSKRHGLLQQR